MNVLKTMRNMSSLKILLWIIVISFVAAMFTVWGTGGSTDRGGRTWLGEEYAVKVEGRTLPPAVFRLQYRFYAERIRQMLGDSFREDFLRGASKTVADGMVRELIVAEMANKYGLSVSDEELAAAIQRMYGFRDPKTEYPAMISRMGVTADEFQTVLRYELLGQKVNDLLASSTYLSDAEIQRLYTEQNEGVKAMVAAVPTRNFYAKAGPASDAEAQAQFDRDKAKYAVPEKRTVDYVMVSQGQIRSGMKFDDAQVKAYYDSHRSEFSIPADQRRASHILIKVDQKASPKDLEAARKKAQDLYAKVRSGADFAALAKANSEDNSAAQGGDLGWFGRTQMVKPFADAVFDTCKAVGDVAGPIQSQFGFHIVKLTGIGGALKPFDEVKAQARQMLMSKDQATQDKVKALFAEVQKAVVEAKDEAAIKAAAAKYGLKVTQVTKPFGTDDMIEGLGMDKPLHDAIAKAPQGTWSEPVKQRDGILRFKVTSVVAAHPAKFDEVKAKILQDLQDVRASVLARSAAMALAASAKDAASLEAAAKKDGYQAQQSGLLKATDAIPGGGKAPEVNRALMAAKVGEVVGPLQGKGAWVVAVVTEHAGFDAKKFETEKTAFAQGQRDQTARQIVDDYVDRRRAALEKDKKIQLNEQLLNSVEPASKGQPG